MTKICFVTTELYPFTSGGIGTLIRNLLIKYKNDRNEFHILLCSNKHVDENEFRQHFSFAKLWHLDDLLDDEFGHEYIDRSYFKQNEFHFLSYRISKALHNLSDRLVNFDIVEFPDWGGLAFCSCQDKLLGFWRHGTIAIRLHSTSSILRAWQPAPGGEAMAVLSDIERKSLLDADVVVAHIGNVAEATRAHFGFEKSWLEKVTVNLPPVFSRKKLPLTNVNNNTNICFTSKIQFLKRPETFLNGCLAFINRNSSYTGNIIFIAHQTDVELCEKIKAQVPHNIADRVIFNYDATIEERNAIISEGISVFPSAFESFCLAAYEASIAGGVVILNEKNPAFSEKTIWKHDVNCVKFDGSALSLAEQLERLLTRRINIDAILYKAEENPYWDKISANDSKISENQAFASEILVSVIVPYYNMGEYIGKTLDSVYKAKYPNIEVIIVDDFSDDEFSLKKLIEIENNKRFNNITIIKSPSNIGLSSARNLGIFHSKGDFIIPIDADDMISENFLLFAVRSLLENPQYSVVISQALIVTEGSSHDHLEVIDKKIFIGEAISSGHFENRYSTATSLFRRSIAERFPYDENMDLYEDWDFYYRIASAGERFIVMNDPLFFYRRRRNSMISALSIDRHNKNLSLMRSKKRFSLGGVTIDMTIINDAQASLSRQLEHYEIINRQLQQKIPNHNISYAERDNVKNPILRAFQKSCFRLKLQFGIWKLRRRGVFDSKWYIEENPDVAASGMRPEAHYLLFGQAEGRRPNGREQRWY